MRNQSHISNINSNQNINKNTDIITTLIHEYLYKKEYVKTLDSYQEELGEKIKSGKYYSLTNKDISDSSLLNYFESGNKVEFFKQWKRLIPNHMKLTEPTLCKLDFNLEIYFALFPIMGNKPVNQKAQSELRQNMEDFKKYLEKKEIELSKTTEFLAYYALPYIPNPKGHPTYAQLFKPEWVKDLKNQLINCIKFYLPSPDKKYPAIYDLINGKNIKMNNNMNYKHKEEEIKNNNNLNNIDNNVINNNINNIENNNNHKINLELKAENEKLIEEIKKLKTKDEKSKIAFIDSQKTWSNLAFNIISYSFGLIDIYNNVANNTQNPQVEKIRQKLVKYQNFLKRNMEELEKNKNANNSSLMVKNDEIDTIENSMLNQNNLSSKKNNNNNNTNVVNYSMKNNINNIKLGDKDTLGNSNGNMNILNEKENDNNINNYSRDENDNINNNNIDNIENQNENIQKGKSIQIDYEPENLIDMKRFISALNHKIQVDDNKLIYIFREIRLRIFRRNNRQLSELTLYELFMYDLFGTLSKSSYLFHELINNQILNLEVMKILNALASLNKGRNYLLAKETLIDDIVQCMIRESTDSDLRQKCLGTIQKFTLRSQPQNKLIELNVIHYIVNLFACESDTLSDYTIEYGLALIMNLSLRKAGREKFEAIADKTIQILQKFMDKDNIQVLTCINGTLYSLLKKQKFKNEARNKGLDIQLKNAKIDNPQLKKQITYILEELNKPPEEEEEYDENFEEDINAKDDDENNYDDYSEGESIDDNFLEEHYKILGDFIIKNNELNKIEEIKIMKFIQNDPSMARALMNNNKSAITNSMTSTFRADDGYKPLHRPTTPMSNMSMTGTSLIYKNNNYKENEYDNNKIKIPEDSAKAFMKKDKIKRTPPRNYDK